jgi:hypothetical protein
MPNAPVENVIASGYGLPLASLRMGEADFPDRHPASLTHCLATVYKELFHTPKENLTYCFEYDFITYQQTSPTVLITTTHKNQEITPFAGPASSRAMERNNCVGQPKSLQFPVLNRICPWFLSGARAFL